jgi:ParB family chromosome partitioning protein
MAQAKVRGVTATTVGSWNVNAPAPASNFLNKLEEGIKKVSIGSIRTDEPFISLLPIRDEVLSAITDNMRIKGFDQSQPLIIWKEQGVLVDGHTRLTAAKAAGINIVPVVHASFKSEDEAIGYMLQIQFSRRNIKDSELVVLAQKTLRSYDKSSNGSKADFLTSKFIGLSATKAKKIYYIVEHASTSDFTRLSDDDVTINRLFSELKVRETDEGIKTKRRDKKVHVDFLEEQATPSAASTTGADNPQSRGQNTNFSGEKLSYSYPYILIDGYKAIGFYDTEVAEALNGKIIGILEKYFKYRKSN